MFYILLCCFLMWYIFSDVYFLIRREKRILRYLSRNSSLKNLEQSEKLWKGSVFYEVILLKLNQQRGKLNHILSQKDFLKKLDLCLPRFERKLDIASVLVQVAPLLGLLGTVTGMILTFGALRDRTLSNQDIADGISQALLTTEFGLLLAIPGIFIGLKLKRSLVRIRYQMREILRAKYD